MAGAPSRQIIEQDIDEIITADLGWHHLHGRSILITGASGMIPSYLWMCLFRKNRKLSAPDKIRISLLVRSQAGLRQRVQSWPVSLDDIEIIEADIADISDLPVHFDYIIHGASLASPKYFLEDPVGVLSANVLGSFNVLSAAKNAKRVLFVSSSEVYGDTSLLNRPILETDFFPMDPFDLRRCYAESKRAGEAIFGAFSRQYGVPVGIVRPFHTYGPTMKLDDGRVFADLVASIVKGQDIELMSQGKTRRSFCYLTDATVAFFKVLLDAPPGEVYNVGNPQEEYSVLQLAEILVGLRPSLNLKIHTAPSSGEKHLQSEVSRSLPSVEKISELGWRPTVSAREGFSRVIRSFCSAATVE